jgi:hypothetical protein
MNGLSARSFGYKDYSSKQMLLRHEVYVERECQALELRSEKIRTYSHLRVDPLVSPEVLCTAQAQEIYWYVITICQYSKLTPS